MQDETGTTQPAGVLAKSIESGKWLSIGYMIQKAIGFVSFFILARLLSPADFGVAAIMLLVPKLLQTATEPGFATAVIQRSGDITKYLNPIWTIGILKSTLIALVVALGAPWLAHFLNAPQAVSAIQIGGLCIFIQNLGNIGETYLFKDLQFKKIFVRNFVRDTSYTLCAIGGALVWRSYWVLIIATLVSYSVQAVSTYFLQSYRPRLSFRFRELADLFNYSKWVIGQGWLDQLYGFVEQSVVSRTAGVQGIGLYSKAKNVASVPTGFLNPVISSVSFPAYARLKEEPQKVREGYTRSLEVIFLFLIPITILILYASGKLVLVFLGSQWLAMADALRIFLLYYLFGSVNDLSNTLLNALGYPKKEVQFNALKIVTTFALIWPLTRWFGITGAALAMLAGTLPTLLFNMGAVKMLAGVRWRTFVAKAAVPLVASALAAAPFILAKDFFLALPTIWLLVAGAGAALVYGLVILLFGILFNRGPWHTVKLIIEHSL